MEYRIPIDEFTQRFSPFQLNAMISALSERELAEEYLKFPITKALLTCLDCFIIDHMDALLEAAELAGLHVQLIMKEFLAADTRISKSHMRRHKNIRYIDDV